MNFLRYLLAALIMYRHPRDGRRRATCCGCGTATAQLATWAMGAGPQTWEGWCLDCYHGGGYRAGCTRAYLGALRDWDQANAVAAEAWSTRTLVPTWLVAT